MPRPRTILAIETSNPSAWDGVGPSPCGVAVGRVNGTSIDVLAEVAIDAGNTREDLLASAIEAVVRGAKLTPRDLTDVAVSIGPGGFTAVRIAVTTAKFIAEATGAACLPVPSAHVAAPTNIPGAFGVALAAKGDTVHLTMFAPSAAGRAIATSSGEIADASALFAMFALHHARALVSDRFLPDSIRTATSAHGIAVVPPAFSPIACLREALHVPAIDPVALLPMYPREPEAVTKWRALHKK